MIFLLSAPVTEELDTTDLHHPSATFKLNLKKRSKLSVLQQVFQCSTSTFPFDQAMEAVE